MSSITLSLVVLQREVVSAVVVLRKQLVIVEASIHGDAIGFAKTTVGR
ncbi:MAG: hypothetical protein HRF42_07600 [Candidatus Brocadia sp.]